MSINTIVMGDTEIEDKFSESQYTNPQRARVATETLVRRGSIKGPVVAVIDHVSKINLMSWDFVQFLTVP